MLNGPDSSLFCRDTGLKQGQLNFFPSLFLYFFQNPKHLFKTNSAVEATKSNRLSSRCGETHLWRIHSKRCRLENWVFLTTLFVENEAQINKNNYRTCLSCQNKSVCQKLARSCQKNENWPKKLYMPLSILTRFDFNFLENAWEFYRGVT